MSMQESNNYFIGVRTTKIYCYPWCRAKKPNPEHITIFKSRKEAENLGYRSCKMCYSCLSPNCWEDKKNYIRLYPPKNFCFREILKYLNRSNIECLHHIENGEIYKVVLIQKTPEVLHLINSNDKYIDIYFENDMIPKKSIRVEAARYVWDWFDLSRDLDPFYKQFVNDSILRDLIEKYNGLRMVTIHDLFETICWAIIGQQINLTFAYLLKNRFVKRFGKSYRIKNETYWFFPRPQDIANLSLDDLTKLHLSRKKAEYIIGVAQKMHSGKLKKQYLMSLDHEKALNELTNIRGIGDWSANYIMMRCLRDQTAFPIEDIGLQNAIKTQLKLKEKPKPNEVKILGSKWTGWEAYATFYLWRDLI